MPTVWDRTSPATQRREQDALLRQTLLHQALAAVPYVRARLAQAGVDARVFRGLADLGRLPMTMRADVLDPEINPAGPAGLLAEAPTADALKRISDRTVIWRVARARVLEGPEGQERALESAARPLHLHLAAGDDGVLPVAYTRDDLDVLARAGARLAAVVGLDRHDTLLNLVPFGPTLDFWGIWHMAFGTGMAAIHARPAELDVTAAAAAAGAPITAIAVAADDAGALVPFAVDAGLDLSALRSVLLVSRSLEQGERMALHRVLAAAGAPDARITCVYAPPEGRVLWGECAVPAGHEQSYGFHTYPDMDLIEIVSPDGGESLAPEQPGEIVLTSLGFRGGGAPRWRTGDLAVGGMTQRRCPNCGRTLPRVGPAIVRNAWARRVSLDGEQIALDLRAVGAAVAGRARDWQVELVQAGRGHELFVYLAPREDSPAGIVELYKDLTRRRATPTQIVLASPQEVAARRQQAEGAWPAFWEREAAESR